MEWVALTDRDLRQLARTDPVLKRVFVGVFPENRLPSKPTKTRRAGYIVNTDPEGEPGKHWLALWTDGVSCEVFDSYGLPLDVYGVPHILAWIEKHWPHARRCDRTLQAMNSRACGHYCLLYLQAKVRGQALEDFLDSFSPYDYVTNDHLVGERVRELIHAQEGYAEGDTVDGLSCQRCETRLRALQLIKSDV